MSAEAAVLTRSWRVGRRTCTMSIPQPKAGSAVHMAVEWSPSKPQRLCRRELAEYRKGRDGAIADLSKQLGLTAAVLEV